MKLMGNLEGVSPNTYPKPPYDIINFITLKAGLGYITLVSVINESALLPKSNSIIFAAMNF